MATDVTVKLNYIPIILQTILDCLAKHQEVYFFNAIVVKNPPLYKSKRLLIVYMVTVSNFNFQLMQYLRHIFFD